MNWLLLVPPQTKSRLLKEYPPIGLGYIATALHKAGEEVDLQDAIINKWDIAKTFSYIYKKPPDILGITMFSNSFQEVKNIVALVKLYLSKTMIILGGAHPTALPNHTLEETQADFAIKGEGEIPILQFVKYLYGENTIEQVRGLIYRKESRVFWNDNVEYDNVDEFGFPAWNLIRPNRYFHCATMGDKKGVIHTGRGCSFSCRFCIKLGKLRHRNLQNIWSELQLLNKVYDINHFLIGDEGFAVDNSYIKQFCRFMIEKKTREMGWTFCTPFGMRLNIIDDEVLELMSECVFEKNFAVGIESIVPRVRIAMGKGLPQDGIIRGLELLKKHNYKPNGNFIIGYPGETRKEIEENIDWACSQAGKLLWGAGFTPFMPLPGNEATRMAEAEGWKFDYTNIKTDNILYAPQGMTIKDIDELRRKAIWRFNFRPYVLWYYLTTSNWGWIINKLINIFIKR